MPKDYFEIVYTNKPHNVFSSKLLELSTITEMNKPDVVYITIQTGSLLTRSNIRTRRLLFGEKIGHMETDVGSKINKERNHKGGGD